MDTLNNILQRCRIKRETAIRQRKTLVTPSFDKASYHLTVYCAHAYPVLVDDLVQANIAVMPLAREPKGQWVRQGFEFEYLYEYETVQEWGIFQWHASWGIRIYAGAPSARDGAFWHDLEFTYEAITTAPEAVSECIEALISLATNLLLTLTPAGGLRFTCRIPDYLQPKSEQIHIYKHTPIPDDTDHSDIYLAIAGENVYTPWYASHEILLGNLLEPPTIEKDILFGPLDKLKAVLHQPALHKITEKYDPLTPQYIDHDIKQDAKLLAVQEGKLSPLAIKRPASILTKQIADRPITDKHFVQHKIPIDLISKWATADDHVLGAFAKTLLNAIVLPSRSQGEAVQRIRNAVYTFKWRESEILEKMQDANHWHNLQKFLDFYRRNADAPMYLSNAALEFYLPSGTATMPSVALDWHPDTEIFQIRTGYYNYESLFDYNAGIYFVKTQIAKTFIDAIEAEVARDTHIKHAIVTPLKSFKRKLHWDTPIAEADRLWIVGFLESSLRSLWLHAQQRFGTDETPLNYVRDRLGFFEDKRLQTLYERTVATKILEYVREFPTHQPNKKVILLTALPVQGITDRPETLLFDWADYEVAGCLNTLPDTIATRERFEAKRDNLTGTSSREDVESVLGCSPSQANRFLRNLRGGRPLRVPFREQILALLADGEKKTSEVTAAVKGNPEAVKNELSRLINTDEIVRVRRGVYTLKSNYDEFEL